MGEVTGTQTVTDSDSRQHTRPYIPLRRPITEFAFWRWEGVFEKWSQGWVNKNYWRIRHICSDREDAIQICALMFVECVNRYGEKVDNPKWLMSLFQRMVINHWNRLSLLDTRQREMEIEMLPEDVPEQVESSLAGLIDIVTSLPTEIRHVFQILVESPAEVLDLLIEGKNEAEDSAAIRRWCGIKDNINVLEEIRRALSGKMSRHVVSLNVP